MWYSRRWKAPGTGGEKCPPYDDASRLETVTWDDASATYSYLVNSPLVEKTEFKHNGQARMTTTRGYDRLNRLGSIVSERPGGSPAVGNGVPPLPAFSYWHNHSSVTATRGQNTDQLTRHAYVPPSTETFSHDLDGNLTEDGRWVYTWDGENRLVGMETRTAAVAAGVPYRRLEYRYDWQGRRVRGRVWHAASGAPVVDLKYVHDGWNLVAEVDAANQVVRSYAWGLDLSGSLHGAGGVGGLLGVNVPGNGAQFAAYDGNGNVAGLLHGGDGAVTASYEYGPFVFDHTAIATVRVEVAAAGMESLRREPRAFVPAWVTMGTELFTNAAVALRGRNSFVPVDQQPNLAIRFDTAGTRDWQGQSRVLLHSAKKDPSLLRQWLAGELFRAAGVPAPRVGHGRVLLNGRDCGLYSVVEADLSKSS